MTKISFTVVFDTEFDPTGKFFGSPFCVVEEKNCEVVHSGSSYLRIGVDGVQIGTIDCYNEFPEHFHSLRFMMSKKQKVDDVQVS